MAEPTKIVHLYDGDVEIEFYGPTEKSPNRHYYKKPGEKDRLLSVTRCTGVINKPVLIPWAVGLTADYLYDLAAKGITIDAGHIDNAKKQYRVVSQEALDIGTQVHEWAELFIKGEKPALPEEDGVRNGVLAFLQWVDEHNIEFISSERLIFSRREDFVGHMDAEAIIDGKRCVIDFKTSKRPRCNKHKECDHPTTYPEWLFQTAAYQKAAEEEGSKYNGPRYILRFDKETGNFDAYKCKGIQKDYKAFVSALNIVKRMKDL